MGDTFYPNGILHPFFGANRIFPPEHTDHFNFKLSPFQGTSLGMSIPTNGMDRGGGQGREKRMYSHEEQSQGQPGGVFSRGHSGTEMITNHLKLCVCMLCAAVCVHVDLSLVSSHFSKIDCTNACTAVYSLSIFVTSDHAKNLRVLLCRMAVPRTSLRNGNEVSKRGGQYSVRYLESRPVASTYSDPPQICYRKNPTLAHSLVKASSLDPTAPPIGQVPPRLITRLDSCMVTGVARSAVRLKEDVSCFERCPTHHTLSMRLSHVQTHPSFIATNVGSWIGTSETKKQVPLYAALLGNRTTSLETIESFCWSTVSQMLYWNEKLIGFAPCTHSSHMAS